MIRVARPEDAAAVQAIYAPMVRDTAISFEREPPTTAEMRQRMIETLAQYPWLVVTDRDVVVGYAYAHRFAERAAYAWSVETSIYLDANAQGQGHGRRLYEALIRLLTAQRYEQAFAGIALPNPASVALHERVGFRPVGVYKRVGWKHNAWHDVGWWQLSLYADNDRPPSTPRSVSEVEVQQLLNE
jgi:L-amino acid N-acyltransferase YncA